MASSFRLPPKTHRQSVYIPGTVKGRALIIYNARRELPGVHEKFWGRFRGPMRGSPFRSMVKVVKFFQNPIVGGHHVTFEWVER